MTIRQADGSTIVQLGEADAGQLDGVAARMSATLVEVVGPGAIDPLYSLAWLRDRALAHVDGRLAGGAVFIAADAHRQVVGHIIVRTEHDEEGPLGLISTIYVLAPARRQGVARQLVDTAHAWFTAHRLSRFATDTSQTNFPLIRLLEDLGYRITYRSAEKRMVRLTR